MDDPDPLDQLRNDAEAAVTRSLSRPWTAPASGRPVLVGVEPTQSPRVVAEAADLAGSLGTGLVCVWVDPAHLVVEREPDGSVDLVPVDSDHDDDGEDSPDDALVARLTACLNPTGVPWRFVYATGEAVRGLKAVADEHDARIIVVGTHRAGLAHWMSQVVSGSVAGRLAHTQRRPVLLVPAPAHGADPAGSHA
ncbi:MAG TPA: universal stress protein [Cellulomonas sp.]